MLDIIRRKAGSWVTRAIFAVVVLVFILFFGYNQISTPNQGPQAILARVNGADIRQSEYNLAFKSTQESYKQVFKGEVPPDMAKMISSSAMQQLINQRLMIDAATKMGLRVSNEELAKAIEGDKRFQKDGQFERAGYRDFFLPSFQREYGLNYEDLLRNELLAKKLDEILHSSVKVSPAEAKAAYWQEKSKFTFEVTKTAPAQAKADKADKTAKAAKAPKPAKQTVGPITLEQRQQVLAPEATEADIAKVFALTKDKPQLDAPITIGDTQYMVKLTKRDVPDDADWKKDEATFTKDVLSRKQGRMTQEWLESLNHRADIEQLKSPHEG